MQNWCAQKICRQGSGTRKRTLLQGCLPVITCLLLLHGKVQAQQGKIVLGANNKTSYTIYLDTAATNELKNAVKELADYCYLTGGFKPVIKAAAGTMQTPFISIGKTPAAVAANLDAVRIPADGFRIITKNSNLFIIGNDTHEGAQTSLGGISRGTVNGVYTFIEDYLGVSWLTPFHKDDYIPHRARTELPTISRLDTPVFRFRKLPYTGAGPAIDQWRLHTLQGGIVHPSYDHAWLATIPAKAFTEHPGWFAQLNGKPLPPSGDYKLETTNPELVQAYANAIIEAFRKDSTRRWYSLSPSDGAGWSDSPESTALTEKDPDGALSRTPLIIRFYNDVAKIVRRVFPDRRLGGYIYASYLYPPAKGLPKLEPNLGLVLAPSIGYGYRLYRPDVRDKWDKLVRAWAETAQRDGFDLYYYDLPTALVQYNGILPPAPEILNFVYSRLLKYGFKGCYVYGMPVWPAFAASNYTIAKLTWDPSLDAGQVLKAYYDKAYGKTPARYIDTLYALLGKAFDRFYCRYPNATYNMTKKHLSEIYAPLYPVLEQYYLQALYHAGSTAEKKRLQNLGHVFSLKACGLLGNNYTSLLTCSDAAIDSLLMATEQKGNPVARPLIQITPEKAFSIKQLTTLPAAEDTVDTGLPLYKNTRLLLHVQKLGTVNIAVKRFDGNAEFICYYLTDAKGHTIVTGGMREGRMIRFMGLAGNDYLLDIPSRGASLRLEITGAATAWKANPTQAGLRVILNDLPDAGLPLYFYVPAGTGDFSITMSDGTIADVITADGRVAGTLDNTQTSVSRLHVPGATVKQGFWKIMLKKAAGQLRIASFSLDKQLPQWLMTNPRALMEINGAVSEVVQGD